MLRKFIVTPILILALALPGFSGQAMAGVISTQAALSAEMRGARETQVRGALARDDVRQAMQQMGVDPVEADGRIASLSDAELLQLQGQLDRLPAGGDSGLVVVGIVFVVLLILELVGVINIFNRI